MHRLSWLTLSLAVLSVVFFLLLIFLRTPFPLYPLASWQDALDLLTPFALLGVYWLLFEAGSSARPGRPAEIAFVLLAVLWTEGHGLHLAANSVDNLMEGLAKQAGPDVTGTSLYTLTYFIDEHVSHYLWHLGVLGLAALLVAREWRQPAGLAVQWGAAVPAGLLYGITCFCIFLEGQTVILGLPAALVFSGVTLVWGRAKLAQRPILAFFFVAGLVAGLLLIGWGLYWGGFPQFSDVGLI